MTEQPLVWDLVEWRQGDGRYRFEVARGGLHATLTAPGGRSLTLPVVAWDGLMDALVAARKTKTRSDRNLPSRAGARWARTETDEFVAAFRSGASLARLAVTHNRTSAAIEAKLAELGLWDRLTQSPAGARVHAAAAPSRDEVPFPDRIPDSALARAVPASGPRLVRSDDGGELSQSRR
jgi:hypothetical protein